MSLAEFHNHDLCLLKSLTTSLAALSRLSLFWSLSRVLSRLAHRCRFVTPSLRTSSPQLLLFATVFFDLFLRHNKLETIIAKLNRSDGEDHNLQSMSKENHTER